MLHLKISPQHKGFEGKVSDTEDEHGIDDGYHDSEA